MNIFSPLFTILLSSFSVIGQSYPIPTIRVNVSEFVGQEMIIEEGNFSISELITVRDFNLYLTAVKRDSSKNFFLQQIPHSAQMSTELVQELLADETIQDQPMPGISWTVAKNYCRWLNVVMKDIYEDVIYDLPTVTEYMSYQQYYQPESCALSCWTLNTKDESVFNHPEEFGVNYIYDASADDPPALKRKIIVGGSFHINNNASSRQYEYQDSSSRFVGFRVVIKSKETPEYKTVETSEHTITAGTLNNHFHGIYEELQNDGNRICGKFHKGQRMGIWTAWDANNVIIHQRLYQNNRDWKIRTPLVKNPYEQLYLKYPMNEKVRNEDGYFDYFHVEERSVVGSKRIWRELNSVNESNLFEQVDFQEVVELALKNELTWYEYGSNAEFRNSVREKSKLDSYKTWDFNRIEIKEDFFLCVDKFDGETRQIAMSFFKNREDSIPSYSLYFPHLRASLATVDINMPEISDVTNLADAFFYNAFRGEIKYFSTLQNRFDPAFKVDDWKIELEKISSEHSFWIEYSPN